MNIRLLTLALTVTFVLLLSPLAQAQTLGAAEANTALTGTRLTYYPRPSGGQCQADCANNPNCQGYTWIQAGTYNPNDAAMCYLMSAVTGRSAARGHYSAFKSSAPSVGSGESNTALTGTRLTYYPRATASQCQADCANNGNCQGSTWIQAGTYNANDAAMCYLMSAVTGRTPARGHFSLVKGSGGTTGGGTGCVGTTNLALNRPAAQSSTSSWSKANDAQGAVDGQKNGGFGFHTEHEARPWWQVDLQQVATLCEIRVFNRMDIPCRARTLQVLVSNDGRNWYSVYTNAANGGGPLTGNGSCFGGTDGKPLSINLAGRGVAARYVRLQLNETEYLHFDEVEIYGIGR